MSLKAAVALFGLICCVGGQTNCNDPNKLDMYGLINVLYIKADRNRDGIITQAELETIWHAFDQNGDEIVTSSEFIPSWAAVSTMTQEMSTAYFYLADLDDNGQITSADLKMVYRRFDMDGSGNVTAQEFNVKWQQLYREAPFAVLYLRADTNKNDRLERSEFGHLFSSLAHNGDGSVAEADFSRGWTALSCDLAQDAGTIFHGLDTNNDKVLMTAEVDHHFAQYDANHNSGIELTELVSMLVRLYPTTGP